MKRVYIDKACEYCNQMFTPTNSRQNRCPKCRNAGKTKRTYENPSLVKSAAAAKKMGVSYGYYKELMNPESRVII